MTAPTALADFLLARFAEDEADARQELADGYGDRTDCGWTSARVLAECEAKRRIVEAIRDATLHPGAEHYIGPMFTSGDVLALLALPYADHPDYDEAWRP